MDWTVMIKVVASERRQAWAGVWRKGHERSVRGIGKHPRTINVRGAIGDATGRQAASMVLV